MSPNETVVTRSDTNGMTSIYSSKYYNTDTGDGYISLIEHGCCCKW